MKEWFHDLLLILKSVDDPQESRRAKVTGRHLKREIQQVSLLKFPF